MKKELHHVNKVYGNHQLARYIDVYEVSANRCHSVPESGYKGTEATLVDEPAWNEKFSSYSITGATLTGNNFILNNDVTAKANYETAKNVTTVRCNSTKNSGFIGDTASLTNSSPAWNEKFSSYSITGSTLTGSNFKFTGSNITAQANFETAKNVTLQTDGHGTIASTKSSGFINDTATLSNTPASHYGFSGYSITGATLTGSNFKFTGSNITAKAWFSAVPYNVTLQTDGHGSIAASKTTGNTNDIITLSNTANNNYYFNNYSITGATLTGNQFKIQTSDVTAKANFAAMPVSSLFVSAINSGISAYTNQTKTFTVNVNTAICNYIKINFYRSYHFDGGNNGMGWSIPELGWTGRNTSVITTALELRDGSFTRNNQYWNSANVVTTGGNQWIIRGTDASTLRYVYDVKNHRVSAIAGSYIVGYGNCSTLGNTLSFKLTVGGTLGSAYMTNFRIAGFRDYTAATAWNL